MHSEWVNPKSITPTLLPIMLNLENLHSYFLETLTDINIDSNESLNSVFKRIANIKKIEKEIVKLEKKRKNEKQFNRQVEIHQKIKLLKSEIECLTNIH